MTFPSWLPGQENPEIVVNEGFDILAHAAVYGRDPDTTSALAWGYLGGRWGGFVIAAGTLTLTDAAANHVVVLRSTGAISVATATTNWDNTTDYARVYRLTTAAGVVTAVEDHRAGAGGVHGGGGGGGFVDPMTTDGDLIVRAGGVPARLGAGTNGHVLTLAGGAPGWAAPASGFANPMTTLGDVIYATTAGAPLRLAIGTAGQVLTVVGGVPAWAAAGAGGLTGFTGALATASPNNTINAARLQANTASANGDLILEAKGTGAIQAQLANSAVGGGNKRGLRAFDVQRSRAAASQVASGDDSFAANLNNTASGEGSAAFGTATQATGAFSFSAGNGAIASGILAFSLGFNTTASGEKAVCMGDGSSATSELSFVRGKSAISRNMKMAEANSTGVLSASAGDCQARKGHLGTFTSDDTFKPLTVSYGAASATNQFDIPTNYAFAFSALVVAKQVTSGNMKAWKMQGLARNLAGTVSIVGTPVYTVIGETGAATWDVRFLADTTNGCVAIEGKGAAAASVYWSADVRTAEVLA